MTSIPLFQAPELQYDRKIEPGRHPHDLNEFRLSRCGELSFFPRVPSQRDIIDPGS